MEVHKELEEEGAQVIGISRDSLESHKKFSEKYAIAFPLLSDEDRQVHELFGVLKLKKLYGREYWGVERSSFIFNAQGELVKEYRGVKVKGHGKEVLDFIRALD